MDEHTPTPWIISEYQNVQGYIQVCSKPRHCEVALCEDWDDAEIVVTAVNAHATLMRQRDELLAALKKCCVAMQHPTGEQQAWKDELENQAISHCGSLITRIEAEIGGKQDI